ncbi:hypothetical protein DL240_05530 [Lujinxingia litoralis]|uniref:FAD/NAD(P)-binding domain-containing protein n=1 Tax=Lujinxingia litoralis TaxID=2211119 RepID=A0A328CCK4_9DELT|nr:NAD(P)/FAD-dependent oxidoreductase [Lujinxingia litoralis]RAL23621.1 hypothetical protein DL240_05530 [Lujinxingia litoralis]
MSEKARVLVVGAGAAGVSAALWLHDFGVPFDWVDASGRIGGLLHRVNNRIDNYPAARFAHGRELAAALRDQAGALHLAPRAATVAAFHAHDDGVSVTFEAGAPRLFDALFLATGTRYRTLGVPGEAECMGSVVSQSSMADAERVAGGKVAVVGGGDAALENALRLASFQCDVHVLMRSAPRARDAFIEEARRHPRIHFAPAPTEVRRIEPLASGCRLHLSGPTSETLQVAALFVRIGVEPVVPDAPGLPRDASGYIVTDLERRTHLKRVFALGDIRQTRLRSVATAVGDGALAARVIATDLAYL